jgi:hypothetical protein
MVNRTGLKSITQRIVFQSFSTTPTTTLIPFSAGSQGLTLISPQNKNMIIRGVEAYTVSIDNRSVSQPANAGLQANFWQLEFFFVDFNGQPIPSQIGFANLFVPDLNIVPVPVNRVLSSLNQIVPKKDFCVLAGGISLERFIYQLQQTTSTPQLTQLTITIWYEEVV